MPDNDQGDRENLVVALAKSDFVAYYNPYIRSNLSVR